MEFGGRSMEELVKNSFWQDRRVFVTGGTGLIGGWLIQELLRLKADVVALVRDWVPNSRLISKEYLDKVTIVRGDLSSSEFLERVIAEYEVKTIFHLAAQTIVPIANGNPLSTFESNIAGTWNLLEASRRCKKVGQIIIASSDKAYGDVPELPYKETMALKAIYPYDVSKACADMIAQSYAKTWDVPVAITRCGNFFGGGDLNWNRIIPGTIRSIIRNERPVIRSNGKLVREYIYVEDAVGAYISLAESLAKNPKLAGEAFNFSNGMPQSVIDVFEMLLKLMDSKLKPQILNEVSGEIESQFLDSSKAEEMLNWKAKYSIEEGLRRTVKWYSEFFGEKRDGV